MFMALDRIL